MINKPTEKDTQRIINKMFANKVIEFRWFDNSFEFEIYDMTKTQMYLLWSYYGDMNIKIEPTRNELLIVNIWW